MPRPRLRDTWSPCGQGTSQAGFRTASVRGFYQFALKRMTPRRTVEFTKPPQAGLATERAVIRRDLGGSEAQDAFATIGTPVCHGFVRHRPRVLEPGARDDHDPCRTIDPCRAMEACERVVILLPENRTPANSARQRARADDLRQVRTRVGIGPRYRVRGWLGGMPSTAHALVRVQVADTGNDRLAQWRPRREGYGCEVGQMMHVVVVAALRAPRGSGSVQ